MHDPLAPLLADGVIDEVVSRLKGGKEADVWLVRSAGQILAAKVYKARQARSFKNDAAYKEGRKVRNTRTQRAMDRGSRFGRSAAEEAWKAKEADALFRLHAAGVRVPRPVLFHEGVLLMEVVVDAHGRPAPRLVDASLTREQAAGIYADLRKQAVGMLACGLIHADLSPYNVLLGHRGPVVIDLPQVVDAAHNSQAEMFFLRDIENIRRFCLSLDPGLGGEGDGREVWRAYVRRELTADFVPSGRAPEPRRAEGASFGHRRQEARDGPSRPHGGAPAQKGPRRPEARGRWNTPAPEVIRVSRPPLGAAGTERPQHGRSGMGHPPPGATVRAGGAPGHRRRRRRRRRGGA
ncbi:MAG TPA: RIO1 family regulatory kinase/ATPase [Anaeromyxobacteraceae bacterium]|nr:RIO1 family regulatory kinase/ATPase [Anaeromyxobacteraceae bacterium]